MSLFSSLDDDDLDRIFAEMDHTLAAQGRSRADLGTAKEFYNVLFEHVFSYLVNRNEYDKLIDFFTVECDIVNDDNRYLALSKCLLGKEDKRRFVRLWRTVISARKQRVYSDEYFLKQVRLAGGGPVGVINRKQSYGYEQTMRAMEYFLDGLQLLGETQLYEQVKEEMQLFQEGKRRKLPRARSASMDESLFWQLISETKSHATSSIDRPLLLTELLTNYSSSAIKQFDYIFRARLDELYRWDLWAVAYISLGGCSDDGFEYFRAWLISEGKEAFDAAIANPESIIEITGTPIQLEPLLYAAAEAYERRADKPLKQKKLRKKAQPVGVPWGDDDLLERFPRVTQKYGWGKGS